MAWGATQHSGAWQSQVSVPARGVLGELSSWMAGGRLLDVLSHRGERERVDPLVPLIRALMPL